jgi:ABC-2 type transport system ATP-binding protein
MLTFTEIRKTFNSTVAVDGLSLEIRRGEVFGLLGPNGAGKTTTVNIAVGLLRPDSGTVAFEDGGGPLDPQCRARIGVAPQALALYEELTGEENLVFFGRLQGLSGKKLVERTDRALEFVGLSDRRGDRVKAYSGGMQRRLNLAVSIIHDPPLLLLDEPTAGVDPQSRNALFDNINALRAEGRTVVYTTHYIEEAQRLCDRVGIIDRGRLLACDTVEGLIGSHGSAGTLVVDCDGGEEIRIETDDPLSELIRLKETRRVESFRVDRPDLEQVFLNLTGRQLRD